MSVRARTAENVAILVILQWFSRILSVVTKIVLVRLLFPEDFGIFALATGLVGFVASFGNFGLDFALIQRGQTASEREYNVAMSLRLIITIALFVVTVASAGPWSGFFADPAVTPTTQVLALIYLIGPWSFIPGTRISADLQYRKLIGPNVAAQLASSLVSIGLAIGGLHVWSLVIGAIAAQVVGALAFAVVQPWGFHFVVDRPTAQSLLGYARHIALASILGFLITNVDNFTVGYLLGSAVLGYYAVAYSLCLLTSQLSGSAASALFPSFAMIKKDPARLQKGYLESFGYATATVAPAAVGIAVMAPEIVMVLLGKNWVPVTIPLVILAFYGFSKSLSDFGSSLFAAVGRPQIIAELNGLVLGLSLVLLFPLTIILGIAGTAVAMTIPVTMSFVLSTYRAAAILDVPFVQVISRARGPLIAAEIMGICVFGIKSYLFPVIAGSGGLPPMGMNVGLDIVTFSISIPAGVVIYLVLLRSLDESIFYGIWRQIAIVLERIGLRAATMR